MTRGCALIFPSRRTSKSCRSWPRLMFLLSREHFSVDGTPIQAWASHKSSVPKDGGNDDADSGGPSGRNTQADSKGRRRSNDTHASTTDPEARLFRKSRNAAAVMAFQSHVLMENRWGWSSVRLSLTPMVWASELQRWQCSIPCPAAIRRRALLTRLMTRATSSTLAVGGALRPM